MKKRILLTSICTIVLSLTLLTGATFALFTSESKTSITVSAGNVEVESVLSDLKTYSLDVLQNDSEFENGGKATLDSELGTLVLENITPGDKATFKLTIKNKSNVTIKYCIKYVLSGELASGVVIKEKEQEVREVTSKISPTWTVVDKAGVLHEKEISIELPINRGNEYQNKNAKLEIIVFAVQGNDPAWDGSSDTSWYNENEKEFTINTPNQLQGLAELVNEGNSFKGMTVNLGSDIDLETTYNLFELTPIGTSSSPFKGTFDGNNHTISNLNLTSNPNMSNVGLFGFTTEGEVKNLTINNAFVKGYLNVGALSGTPYTTKYTNIKLTGLVQVEGFSYVGALGGKNAYANWDNITVDVQDTSYVKAVSVEGTKAYRTYVGGVIGFMGEGTHKVSNVTSNIDVYGSTCDVGGIVGIAHYGNTFENVTCTGDVYLLEGDSLQSALEVGGIAGVWNNGGSNVTLTNCKFNGTINAYYYNEQNEKMQLTEFSYDSLVGKAYGKGNGTLVIDSNEYSVKTSKDALVESLSKGENVTLGGDLDVESSKGGYNLAGLALTNGVVFDGNGYTFSVENANSTWDCAIYTSGATIKNVTISKAFRGIFTAGCSSDIICENVIIDDVCYTFSSDGANENYSVLFNNSTLNGWTSYSGNYKNVEFNNCYFGKGTGDYKYAYMRPYSDTVMTNCIFEEGFSFDSTKATTTLVNCYMNGVLITEQNKVELLGSAASNLVIDNK